MFGIYYFACDECTLYLRNETSLFMKSKLSLLISVGSSTEEAGVTSLFAPALLYYVFLCGLPLSQTFSFFFLFSNSYRFNLFFYFEKVVEMFQYVPPLHPCGNCKVLECHTHHLQTSAHTSYQFTM